MIDIHDVYDIFFTDVTQAAIPLEFFQAKAVFPYNTDKEGNPISKFFPFINYIIQMV